jgi:hypothetical protein
MAKTKWFKKAVGEISKLRNMFSSVFSLKTGIYMNAYKLDSSRVDYKKAKELYYNTDENYKLGAGFAKPVINTTVGFMGVPRFKSEDVDAQDILDNFFADNTSKMQRTHQNALRDGDSFVWVTREETVDAALYPEAKTRLVFNIIPPEQVTHIILDPITSNVKEYILQSSHTWVDDNNAQKTAVVVQRITATKRKVQIIGDTPPDIEAGETDNPWGFIPIVHFRNEWDETKEFGQSDLEPIEPFMKAYHDVLLHAIQGSKMHSTPRLKLKVKNLEAFLRNNFGVTDPQEFAAKGGTINLEGHEFFLFTDDEDASFIEVQSAIGDAAELLKLLFYCIVDTSETPEFVFGVHTPSSLSSVREQMPILIRRIARKREQFTESWQRLARIVLAMTAQAEIKKISTYATVLEWDEVDPRDEKDVAEILDKITNALDTATKGDFLSHEAAVTFLAQYISTMNDYISDDPEVPGERERIMVSRLMKMRLEDAQFLDVQKKEIDAALGKAKKGATT